MKLQASNFNFEIVLHRLKDLYQVSDDFFEYNINHYLTLNNVNKKQNDFSSPNDFTDVSFEEIKEYVDREEKIKDAAKQFVNDYEKRNISLEEAAILLGVLPSKNQSKVDVFYPYLMNFDGDISSKVEISDLNLKKEANLKIIVSNLVDKMRDGQQFMNENGRMIWSQGYARYLYRGESAFYPKTKASIFRSDGFERIIVLLRQIIFLDLISRLKYIDNWNREFSDIDFGAIAQHYSFDSQYLDISSNPLVSLFFACCKFDERTNTWHPLNNNDFERTDSREKVHEYGGDSRYGILYSCPFSIIGIQSVIDPNFPKISPIGYSPFLRSEFQSAYTLKATNNFDLKQFPYFYKYKFRLTEEICNWIYEKMDKGKNIYPHEYSTEFMNFVNIAKNTTKIPSRIFNGFCEEMFLSKDEITGYLTKHGFQIVEGYEILDDEEMNS